MGAWVYFFLVWWTALDPVADYWLVIGGQISQNLHSQWDNHVDFSDAFLGALEVIIQPAEFVPSQQPHCIFPGGRLLQECTHLLHVPVTLLTHFIFSDIGHFGIVAQAVNECGTDQPEFETEEPILEGCCDAVTWLIHSCAVCFFLLFNCSQVKLFNLVVPEDLGQLEGILVALLSGLPSPY